MSVTSVYRYIIDDVIRNVRAEFANEGLEDRVIGDLQFSLRSIMNIPQNDGTIETKEEIDTFILQKISQNQSTECSFSINIPQLDGNDDDLDEDLLEEHKPDNTQDSLNSDLDDDEDNDPDPVIEHFVLCQYEKVSRIKNKRKCNFKDGVMHLNGRDTLFHKANGENHALVFNERMNLSFGKLSYPPAWGLSGPIWSLSPTVDPTPFFTEMASQQRPTNKLVRLCVTSPYRETDTPHKYRDRLYLIIDPSFLKFDQLDCLTAYLASSPPLVLLDISLEPEIIFPKNIAIGRPNMTILQQQLAKKLAVSSSANIGSFLPYLASLESLTLHISATNINPSLQINDKLKRLTIARYESPSDLLNLLTNLSSHAHLQVLDIKFADKSIGTLNHGSDKVDLYKALTVNQSIVHLGLYIDHHTTFIINSVLPYLESSLVIDHLTLHANSDLPLPETLAHFCKSANRITAYLTHIEFTRILSNPSWQQYREDHIFSADHPYE
eukprot:gene16661-19799_t